MICGRPENAALRARERDDPVALPAWSSSDARPDSQSPTNGTSARVTEWITSRPCDSSERTTAGVCVGSVGIPIEDANKIIARAPLRSRSRVSPNARSGAYSALVSSNVRGRHAARELDDEGQRRPGLSDPRNPEVRPLACGAGRPLSHPRYRSPSRAATRAP